MGLFHDDLCADLADISGQISGGVGHDVSSIMLFPARQLEFPIVGAERRAANIVHTISALECYRLDRPWSCAIVTVTPRMLALPDASVH
jgi:hypothetical protein